MGGLGSPYGQPGHHSPNGGGSVSSKRTINRSEWESRCLWLSILPFRSANYLAIARLFSDVPGPGTYEGVAPVLLYGVADPTDGPAQGEERDGTARWQPQRPCHRRQREIYGGMLVHQSQHLSGNTIGERNGDTLGIGPGRQAKQPGSAGISFRIKRVPEPRDTLSPPETDGDHRPRVPRGIHLLQKGLDELYLPPVLDAPERRKPGHNNGIGRGLGRGDTPGSKGRDG